VGGGGFGVAVAAGGRGAEVAVGGSGVDVGGTGTVGVGGGVVGTGVDVGSGVDVGLACTEGVAVKVGTKVLVGVGVAAAAPNRPPRDGPRNIAVDAPRTQTNATARATTKIVNSLLLISEFSLQNIAYYRMISRRVQIRYSHGRCVHRLLVWTAGERSVERRQTDERLGDPCQPGLRSPPWLDIQREDGGHEEEDGGRRGNHLEIPMLDGE
jgi:hypothetical protein